MVWSMQPSNRASDEPCVVDDLLNLHLEGGARGERSAAALPPLHGDRRVPWASDAREMHTGSLQRMSMRNNLEDILNVT